MADQQRRLLPKHASTSLFALLTANFVLFGASMTVFGAAIPSIIRQYDWRYSTAGIVLAASSVGYFSSTFISGFLVKRIGSRWMVVSTLMIEGLSFLFFARFPSVSFNAMLGFLIGFGQGGTEVVSNITVIRVERDGRSRLMNLLHASFCVGAFAGPLGVAGLLQSKAGWKAVFPAMGVVVLVAAALLSTQKYPGDGSAETEDTSPGPPPGELSETAKESSRGTWRRILGMYAAIILLYVGIELSISNWSAEFFVSRLGSAGGAGALMVAVLWIGLLVGRLGLSFFYHGRRQEIVLLVLNVASTLFLLLMLSSRTIAAAAVFIFLIGVGLSGVYPLVMSLVGKRSQSTIAVGIVSTAGGVGSFSFPFILAFLADQAGIYRAFYFCLVAGAVMVAITAGICVVLRRTRSAE